MGAVNLLLDTHAFLWWLFDDPHLSPTVRERIRDPDNGIYVSSASVWEITTKYRLGKLPYAEAVVADVPGWIDRAQMQPLPIAPAHAALAGQWQTPHRDPFDRMLAAQSQLEGLQLASVDRALKKFPVVIVW